MIRIAVDAMGGDYAPREVVHGSLLAAKEYGVAIQLVGIQDKVESELKRHDITGLDVQIIPSADVVDMGEKPTAGIRKKKDSSIVVATKRVADGLADAVVAAGSTGAAAVAAQLGLGRIRNVERSAIACTMPTIDQVKRYCIVIDVGANVECSASQLLQFAHMGAIVYTGMFGIEQPRVGLLNNGTEETKGNALVQETYKLLKDTKLNFIGFCEGRDFPMDKVDVVVTDGFTGNVALKTAEGIAKMISHMLKQELMADNRGRLAGILAKPALEAMRRRVDYNETGGALLVGVKGVCVIAHGGSKHTAIKNAVRVAKSMVAAQIVQKIEKEFSLSKETAGTKS
jgi:phosphate acyltransferase